MEQIVLKPLRTDVLYEGKFTEIAFGLLSNTHSLYAALLKHLGKYGATLQNLRIDESVLANANISCSLLNHYTNVTIRLQSCSVYISPFHQVGKEVASMILNDFTAAIHDAGQSVEVGEHVVSVNVDTQIVDSTYSDLLRRYVTIPSGLGEKTQTGVAFYYKGNQSQGELDGNIVLDRIPGQEKGLVLKINQTFDAKKVPIENLAKSAAESVTQYLNTLGLKLETEQGK